MNCRFNFQAAALAAVLFVVPLAAQEGELKAPNRADADKMFAEMVDLMEASAIVVPGLARAAAPLTENVRQAALTLSTSREHVGVVYRLLTNARIFMQLLDAMPKTSGFSGAVRQQTETLRLDIDRTELYLLSLLERREEQIRGGDRDNLKRYSEANATLGPPAEGEIRVAFMGDSITDGWELNQYFPSKPYVNRGISGQITGEMLGRMQADVIELGSKIMVFLGGTNDLARGVSLQAIRQNLSSIMDLAQAHDIVPIMGSILPVSDYHAETDPRYSRTADRPPADIVALNEWLKQECVKRSIPYLDYYSAVVDEKGMLRADLSDDGLHPNTEGYKIMAPLAQKLVDAESAKGSKNRGKRKKRFGVF